MGDFVIPFRSGSHCDEPSFCHLFILKVMHISIVKVKQLLTINQQASLECHNIRMTAPNTGSKIDGKIGEEPVFFYDPFIGQYVSVVVIERS